MAACTPQSNEEEKEGAQTQTDLRLLGVLQGQFLMPARGIKQLGGGGGNR